MSTKNPAEAGLLQDVKLLNVHVFKVAVRLIAFQRIGKMC